MERRKFIRSTLSGSVAILAASPFYSFCSGYEPTDKSRVVLARDKNLQDGQSSVHYQKLAQMLDDGMQQLYQTSSTSAAWQKVVKPAEVIGLKINCLSGHGVTNPELVDIIIERLRTTGVRANNIIVWDRFNSDLEECKYKINYSGNGVRFMGNDVHGFESDFTIFGSAASLLCKTLTKLCDGVINLPVLKDHGIAGITMSMKNLFGAIHNPHKYHLDVGNPYIPDVYSFSPIKSKIRLHICDAINPQYEGGPSYMPQWTWKLNGIMLSNDPVAMDFTGWQLIETASL